jgi:hypothetical protein
VDARGLGLRFQVTRGADAHHLLDQIKLDGGVAVSAEGPAETKSTPSST